MTTTQKFLVATVVAIAASFTIYQASHESDTSQAKSSRQSAGSSDSAIPAARVRSNGHPAGRGPRYLLQPRLDEAGKRHLQQDPGTLPTGKSAEGWSRADDDLLVAWAAQDPEAAMKWVDGGERAPVRAQLLGAVAAGILLRDGKDAMRRFLDEHQQDPGLLPKHQGALDTYLFYHLGREDTFGAAMEILSGSDDGSLAGAMISGIDGAQYQTNAIDYMEAKGIPVDMDYWKLQEHISKDPRFWADWALQRDSSLIGDIVDGWARDQPADAKAWVEERVSKNDKHRKEIDERLQLRANPPE